MRTLPLLLALSPFAAVVAQNRSVVPAACAALPGNAALSLPLRWSHGALQVFVDSTLLPTNFVGRTISGLRLRRPAFLREPAYQGLQRTLTVRGCFRTQNAQQIGQDLTGNRPAATAVLFGPAQVSVAATPAQGADTAVGAEFLDLPFTTPLPVIAGNLFLEFDVDDQPLQIDVGNWVDAVWFDNGNETGYAVPVGSGSCTTRSTPTELVWTAATGPQVGGTATLRLTGAAPSSFVYCWVGFDPVPRAPSPTYMGWGGSLAPLSAGLLGCYQWVPLDSSWSGSADTGGGYTASFTLASSFAVVGQRIGVQAAWIDSGRPGLPLSASNGVVMVPGNIGVGLHCSTVFFPAGATWSPWLPYYGQMPVLTLLHD